MIYRHLTADSILDSVISFSSHKTLNFTVTSLEMPIKKRERKEKISLTSMSTTMQSLLWPYRHYVYNIRAIKVQLKSVGFTDMKIGMLISFEQPQIICFSVIGVWVNYTK